jgi:rhodanese-related sulfurtransferase
MEATRVTVDEVKERMERGEQFAFVDTRNPVAWGESDAKLPGAVRVPASELEQHLSEIPRVHPLYGGFDAWRKAGLPVDSR